MSSILTQISAAKADVFRRAYIKRRSAATGLFESAWYEVTDDVKKFGSIKKEIDSARLNKFTFASSKLVFNNDAGLYNPHDNEFSLWYNYLNQQRTLVKIEAGIYERILRSDGVWTTIEHPGGSTRWDEALFDYSAYLFDQSTTSSPVVFVGIVSGDIPLTDSNEVTFNLKPLTSLFQDYPARNLTGWTSTGITASQFVTMLRDQTDGSGSFIFRPFFGDTTTYWDISSTSNVYSNLNTSTAADVFDKTTWEVIEKLAEAENFVPYITREGIFKFVSRASNTTTVAFEFHGAGSYDTEYGQTIKKITSYSKKISKYYSRVQVKFQAASTITSYVTVESSFSVSPSSNPWVLGHRTFSLENLLIPNTATASTIATTIFNDYSALKNEIAFTTSFIPQLDILDRVSLNYDPSEISLNSLWDQNDWAGSTDTDADLIFDNSAGDAIQLSGDEFAFLSIELNLDTFENTFVAREV